MLMRLWVTNHGFLTRNSVTTLRMGMLWDWAAHLLKFSKRCAYQGQAHCCTENHCAKPFQNFPFQKITSFYKIGSFLLQCGIVWNLRKFYQNTILQKVLKSTPVIHSIFKKRGSAIVGIQPWHFRLSYWASKQNRIIDSWH